MIALFSHRKRMTEEEFDRLFRSAYPRLYRMAYALLGDVEDSRDVVSIVFADLLDKHDMSAEINEGYLMAMVRNRSVDLLRHRRVEDEARQSLMHESRCMSTDTAHEERIRKIMSFIDTELTPQTRKVLQLCYDEKMTYKQAASELGISVQAVNKHVSQALHKLRERFNPTSVKLSNKKVQ